MKILIIDDEKSFHNIINNVLNTSEYDVTIFLQSCYFAYGKDKFEFSNLIEFVIKLEKENIEVTEIEILGSVLNYSSELNVRTILSGLINLPTKSFVYYEKTSKIESSIHSLNRCFNAIGVVPQVDTLDLKTLKLTVDKKLLWEQFSLSSFKKKVNRLKLDNDALVARIENAIDKKERLSLIRLNHCENRIMGYGFTFDKKEAEITYDIQFGYSLSDEQTSHLSTMIKQAVKNANILGTPAFRDNSSDKLVVLENSTYIHLNKLSLYCNQSFTSVNCHYDLGRSLRFKKSLEGCDALFAITCRDTSRLEKSLGRTVNRIIIPAENRFADSKTDGKKHFPERFNEIECEISRSIKPGVVVLVGAGILGKIYCAMVKDAGGIAIDVGSLMDAIADLNTRGSGFSSAGFWWE